MGATFHHLKYMTNCYKNIFVLISCNGNQQLIAQRVLHIKFPILRKMSWINEGTDAYPIRIQYSWFYWTDRTFAFLFSKCTMK